jgi:hypothetical protein
MFPNDPKKLKLVRDSDGMQTFRDLETGEEFSATISKPMGAPSDPRLARLICTLSMARSLPQQITILLRVVRPEEHVSLGALLKEARDTGEIVFSKLRRWRAEDLARQLREQGFTSRVIFD